jgi:hypothetical protein
LSPYSLVAPPYGMRLETPARYDAGRGFPRFRHNFRRSARTGQAPEARGQAAAAEPDGRTRGPRARSGPVVRTAGSPSGPRFRQAPWRDVAMLRLGRVVGLEACFSSSLPTTGRSVRDAPSQPVDAGPRVLPGTGHRGDMCTTLVHHSRSRKPLTLLFTFVHQPLSGSMVLRKDYHPSRKSKADSDT